VRHAIGADTLGYISLDAMVSATEQPRTRLCCACFDGKYPIELPSETALGKNVIEHMLSNAARAGAGPVSVMQSDNDNASALRRP
jgi:amidophosphoribosyltransferase